MSESDDDNDNLIGSKGKKAHRGMFTQKPNRGFGMLGDSSDDNEMYDSEDAESEDEQNAFNNNNAFNQPVY
jgi:hypothetical protein